MFALFCIYIVSAQATAIRRMSHCCWGFPWRRGTAHERHHYWQWSDWTITCVYVCMYNVHVYTLYIVTVVQCTYCTSTCMYYICVQYLHVGGLNTKLGDSGLTHLVVADTVDPGDIPVTSSRHEWTIYCTLPQCILYMCIYIVYIHAHVYMCKQTCIYMCMHISTCMYYRYMLHVNSPFYYCMTPPTQLAPNITCTCIYVHVHVPTPRSIYTGHWSHTGYCSYVEVYLGLVEVPLQGGVWYLRCVAPPLLILPFLSERSAGSHAHSCWTQSTVLLYMYMYMLHNTSSRARPLSFYSSSIVPPPLDGLPQDT